MSIETLVVAAGLTIALPAQAPPPPQAPPVKESKESQCKCSGTGKDACNCPGKECAECGCQCGKQRQWTPCNRPCCCGCQDEDGAYCDCGTTLYGGTRTPPSYTPAPALMATPVAATTMLDRRPRPVFTPAPRPTQPYCPPGGT